MYQMHQNNNCIGKQKNNKINKNVIGDVQGRRSLGVMLHGLPMQRCERIKHLT